MRGCNPAGPPLPCVQVVEHEGEEPPRVLQGAHDPGVGGRVVVDFAAAETSGVGEKTLTIKSGDYN